MPAHRSRFTICKTLRISLYTCLSLLFLAFLSASAWAEEGSSPEEPPTVLEEVVVEGEAPSTSQPQQDISAFGQVLVIDELPGILISLTEALETATGLNVRDFGGLGKLSTVTLRGLSSRDVLVMLDGIPLNSSALGGVDLSDISLAAIERIEIIRGPEAALYGNNSAGGIINIIRGGGEEQVGRYAIRAGSFGYLSGDLSFFKGDDEFDFTGRIYGTTYRGEFPFLNDNGTTLDASDDFTANRSNNEYDSWGVFTRLSRSSGDWRHGFDIDAFRARKGIPGLTTFPTPDADQTDSRYLLHCGGVNEGIAGGNGELSFDLSWLRTSRVYIDPSGGATGQPVDSKWNEARIGGSVAYSEFVGDSHYIKSGIDWGHYRFIQRDADNHGRNALGVYIRDEISIGDSILIPALRYDSIGDAGSRLSPKLGWRYEPSDDIVIKANWAAAFRAPTFEELYRNEGFVIGNPDLKPEKTWMADVGFVYKQGPLRFEADYFRGRAVDLIEYVLGSGFRYRPLNFGKARLTGYEAQVRYDLDNAWRFEANVTHTSATDVTDEGGTTYGKQIPGRPEWDAYGGAAYEAPSGDWGAYLGAYFAGGRYLTAANTKKLDDDLSVNMGFTLQLNDKCEFAFEVKNIFDEDLMDVRGFPLPGRTYIISLSQEV